MSAISNYVFLIGNRFLFKIRDLEELNGKLTSHFVNKSDVHSSITGSKDATWMKQAEDLERDSSSTKLLKV